MLNLSPVVRNSQGPGREGGFGFRVQHWIGDSPLWTGGGGMEAGGASLFGFFWEVDADGGLVAADNEAAQVPITAYVAASRAGARCGEVGASLWEVREAREALSVRR